PVAGQVLGDVLLVGLQRAAADLQQLGVAPQALDHVLSHVAVAAQDLNRRVGDLLAHGGRDQLDPVRVDAAAGPLQVHAPGGVVDVGPGRLPGRVAAPDVALDLPEVADRAPERLALVGVAAHDLQA